MRQLLCDIAEIGAGQGAPQGDSNYCNDGIPFIKAGNMEDLSSGGSLDDIQKVSEEVAKAHKLKLYPKGTILFAKSGMSCLKGYVYVLPRETYVVSHLACITPHEDISEYLRYYFTYHKPNKLVKDPAYPSISLADIGKLEIDTKGTKERADIISTLSSAESIIDLRMQELRQLDNLIKARFVEMFGDPIANPKGWKLVNLSDLTDVGSSKRIFEKEYVSEGVPFYRTKEIVELSKGHSITTELFITKERFDEIKKQYGAPKSGDLLVSAVGTIGIIWIVDGQNDFYFKDGNLIRVDGSDKFNSVYMKFLLEELISEYKKQMSAGTAYAALTISGLSKMKVYDVPIDMQIQFASFVEQVDKSKVVVRKALDEAQLLFDSLMQKYFG